MGGRLPDAWVLLSSEPSYVQLGLQLREGAVQQTLYNTQCRDTLCNLHVAKPIQIVLKLQSLWMTCILFAGRNLP